MRRDQRPWEDRINPEVYNSVPKHFGKFRLKLKKAGKTARPLKYDLNKIPYDYTVEVANRFKGLDLIESLMNYNGGS